MKMEKSTARPPVKVFIYSPGKSWFHSPFASRIQSSQL